MRNSVLYSIVRLLSVAMIVYCGVELLELSKSGSDVKVYACSFGYDFSEKHLIYARNEQEAKHKTWLLEPDTIHDIKCELNE